MTLIARSYDPALDSNPYLKREGVIGGRATYGPTASALAQDPDIRRYLIPNLLLSETSVVESQALGSFRTYWILNPSDPDKGIWAVNVTTPGSVMAKNDAGAPMVDGYYYKIGDIPPVEVMRSKFDTMSFRPGFRDDYHRFYPDPLIEAANKSAAEKAAEDKRIGEALRPIERETLELSVVDNIIIANKKAVDSAEDEAHPGVSLAGKGAWKRFVGDKKPQDFDLPKPLLAFDPDSGTVGPAREEYESVLEAAQKGDRGAQAALEYLGLRY